MEANPEEKRVLHIAFIAGSTRPGRRSRLVADWAHKRALDSVGDRVEMSVIDLADVDLPLLNEPVPAAIGAYSYPHTRSWADLVSGCDGFVFVVPEYNHSFPAALKNAIDYLYSEWNDKAAGFVSFGTNGGVRAAEQLRLVLAEVKIACVRTQVNMGLFDDFDLPDITQQGQVAARGHHNQILDRMLNEVIEWATAMRSVRDSRTS